MGKLALIKCMDQTVVIANNSLKRKRWQTTVLVLNTLSQILSYHLDLAGQGNGLRF